MTEIEAQLKDAMVQGFTRITAFPPIEVQQDAYTTLVHEMAHAAEPLSGGTFTYNEPLATESLGTAMPKNRPIGSYLLATMPGNFPDETRNRTAPQAEKLFKERGWVGLTASEFLILQRLALIENGDQRFMDYIGSKDQPAQWQWLLDTHVPEGCAAAYWYEKEGKLTLYACKVGSKNERRGAHPARVIPLG